jgi:uncharacterized membrane protein
MTDNTGLTATGPTVSQELITYTNVIYALHATSVVLGLATSATVVGSFIFGIPSIIAVIMNYARISAVRGTFLESHFRWQIRTFWFAVLWSLIVAAVSAVLIFILIGIATWLIGMACVALWVMYRVARGWLALRDRRAMAI